MFFVLLLLSLLVLTLGWLLTIKSPKIDPTKALETLQGQAQQKRKPSEALFPKPALSLATLSNVEVDEALIVLKSRHPDVAIHALTLLRPGYGEPQWMYKLPS